jgi:hypothetical protein
MLGNPLIQPWKDLAALTPEFEMRELAYGTWYVCRGTKPVAAGTGRPDLPQLMAAE